MIKKKRKGIVKKKEIVLSIGHIITYNVRIYRKIEDIMSISKTGMK